MQVFYCPLVFIWYHCLKNKSLENHSHSKLWKLTYCYCFICSKKKCCAPDCVSDMSLSPEEVHKWRQPLLECREGCLCARCSVHTGTPSAGYLSSSKSQGNGPQWCDSQTWCCPHVDISAVSSDQNRQKYDTAPQGALIYLPEQETEAAGSHLKQEID